ncbi:hypothetical protein SPRG_02871 [Saprolegnia parasitica CBS 223.65]|uniref:RING-type domain-containing protein n=1 Tax=Saprolegnia parasitica (strain CBS 223.65) TaxID=695850 RepID=A0A067CNV9_SAPPC|nr:hypothetical protein SPRG_02871 [Saprolegnia parasitica CBS 223.65]KDO32394.1 hypothetical protein SPRG_02871 [Saprolegnia parasitica CBS 223.65]|eukprot:XP_012196848.1 hypothetical protein SPRG_02871 [Saprolegnia parasitica CBS 223.65]
MDHEVDPGVAVTPTSPMAVHPTDRPSSAVASTGAGSRRDLFRTLSSPLSLLFPAGVVPPPNSPVASTQTSPTDDVGDAASLLRDHEDVPEPLRAANAGDESSSDEQLRSEMRQLFRRFQNVLPFSILLLLYLSYQHTKGIAGFVIGTIAIITLDIRFREQVALKDKSSVCSLLGIILVCLIDLFAIASLNGDITPNDTFLKKLDDTQAGSLGDVLWAVMANDYILRFTGMTCKALVAVTKLEKIAPVCGRGPTVNVASMYRRKRKLYALIEFTTLFLRTMVAAIPWCSYYQSCASKVVADVFALTYLGFKGYVLGGQAQKIYDMLKSLVTFSLEFGAYVTPAALAEAGNPECSICYDAMHTPVQLRCSHMFCEECVCEWFDRERNCPLCRADVASPAISSSSVSETKPLYLDGGTPLIPQFL